MAYLGLISTCNLHHYLLGICITIKLVVGDALKTILSIIGNSSTTKYNTVVLFRFYCTKMGSWVNIQTYSVKINIKICINAKTYCDKSISNVSVNVIYESQQQTTVFQILHVWNPRLPTLTFNIITFYIGFKYN